MEMVIAFVVSFALTALVGGKVILPMLRRLKAGQAIREEGPKWHMSKSGTPTMGGLMFIIVGNYLPKCKQNYTIGIKIPWTLNSEENWNKTHRFAGWLWTICGILIMLTGFLGSFWVFLPIALLMVIVPVVYSYILHRKGM